MMELLLLTLAHYCPHLLTIAAPVAAVCMQLKPIYAVREQKHDRLSRQIDEREKRVRS